MDDKKEKPVTEARSSRGSVKRLVSQGFGLLAVIAGASLIAIQFTAPEEVERVSGAVVGSVRSVVQEASTAVTNDLPQVTLGAEADNAAIDSAPAGVFPEMREYKKATSLQPVFAAHNGSGGDIILPWELGERVLVIRADGTQQEMVVTDARDTPQEGVTTRDLAGMRGSILLQTCYWDRDDMKFVALTPAGETPTVPDSDDSGGDTPLVIP